ncbi:protein rep [Flavobacterium phycosphaerae]|uniref:protein rep n=1 Tax=Flavobacterium phycosphaerae TaxID=2697515 RepID=UPI00138ACD23|nr:protein rep [Flavobacterium phycosphaerae]
MAQIFDKQYFSDEQRYKMTANDSHTDLVHDCVDSHMKKSKGLDPEKGIFGNQKTLLDNNTVLVRHTDSNLPENLHHTKDFADIYKTLLFRMRNVAKTNSTIKEIQEHRRPRIHFCGYAPHHPDTSHISMCKSDTGNYFFNGLANCGGYWRCPVCAVKISENKKELITRIITAHQSKKMSIGFLTLTVRHSKHDTLKKSLDKILSNYRTIQNQRFYSRGKKDIGLIGQIKTLEITKSWENGWHPHLHLLFFYNHNDVNSIQKFQKNFISKWFKFKDNNGLLRAQNQKMVTSDISDYLAKYDITSEMTKGNIKGSKGLTPFTALGKLALNDFENHKEKAYLYGMYCEYVEQTQGRHYVNISKSISKLYHDEIKDLNKTDQEIVDEVTIDEILLKISIPIWKKIAQHDLQPLVINKWKQNGIDGVYNLLTYFRDFENIMIEIDKNNIHVIT